MDRKSTYFSVLRSKRGLLIVSLIVLITLSAILSFIISARLAADSITENNTEDVIGSPYEIHKLEYTYIGRSLYDARSAFSWKIISPEMLITEAYQITTAGDLTTEIRRGRMEFSEYVDFNENSLVVSYGREVLEMSYSSTGHHAPFLILTFSEHHDAEVAYFYTMTTTVFAPAYVEMHCYIMNDGKRIPVSRVITDMTFTVDDQREIFERDEEDFLYFG